MQYEARQAVHLPIVDYLELEFRLMDTRPGVTPEKFVTDLVKRWLAVEHERAPSRDGPALRGFQWKDVFLPDGTHLRTSYGSRIEFAAVRGDRIVADDGTVFTPSQFANRYTKGRNAWRFIWLRFPGREHWSRADDCRERIDRSRGRAIRLKQTDTV